MKLSESRSLMEEKKKLRELHGLKKIEYIWDYYKLPLAVICIVLYIIGYSIYGYAAQKDTELCTALVNVSVSDSLADRLGNGYLEYLGEDTSKQQVELFTGLYLTEDEASPDHEYTYASQVKLLSAIDSRQLDVVLMNREALDVFSRNGYLCNLGKLLSETDPALYTEIEPYLVTGAAPAAADSSDSNSDFVDGDVHYPEGIPVGLDVSQAPMLRQAGFGDTVYVGIIENSERKNAAADYIEYLFAETGSVS